MRSAVRRPGWTPSLVSALPREQGQGWMQRRFGRRRASQPRLPPLLLQRRLGHRRSSRLPGVRRMATSTWPLTTGTLGARSTYLKGRRWAR